MKNKRTSTQNRSLHLMFTHLADELNKCGYEMQHFFKQSADIPWTPVLVKELIWRPVQKAMLEKKSTTELSTVELDKVFEVLQRYLAEKHKLEIQFPSIDTLIDKMKEDNENQSYG